MNTAFVRAFRERIKRRRCTVAVVGLGYVGLPLALAFAKKGFSVTGIEVDEGRLEGIRKGISYITDVSSKELRAAKKSGSFKAVGSFSAISDCDCVLICVPTPLKRISHPDISYIIAAVKAIKRHLRKGHLIILESTTYPGTTEEVILPQLTSSTMRCGEEFFLAFSPERIDPGNASFPVHKIPKVVGGVGEEATACAALLYGAIIERVTPVSSARVAESVKLLENTFRIVNIGLIDELAMMAHAMKIDIWEVIDAAKTKPFGFMPFYPGPGVGGHCIPKDPLYLYWKARKYGFSSRFIRLASQVVGSMPSYVVERVRRCLHDRGSALRGARILVVGATYKKDIKDLRKSPAIDIITLLQQQGARVSFHDPLIPYLALERIHLTSRALNRSTLSAQDCVVIATDHSRLDYRLIANASRLVFDTRNVFSGKKADNIVTL